MITLPTQPSPRIAELLKKTQAKRGKLIFSLDATASRKPAWDLAMGLMMEMSEQSAMIGNLDIQLVHYGANEVRNSSWFSDASELVSHMSTISCRAGATQIARVLRHIKAEHTREKVSAAVFVGDAVEERPSDLYDAAAGLGVPVFTFQEGDDDEVEQVFREIARLSGGAYGKFDAEPAKVLGEMLRAVVAFAVGGITALANQRTDSARRLLGQMK